MCSSAVIFKFMTILTVAFSSYCNFVILKSGMLLKKESNFAEITECTMALVDHTNMADVYKYSLDNDSRTSLADVSFVTI